MLLLRIITAACTAAASALPAIGERATSPPTVHLSTGTYRGFTNNSIDTFLGIRYATPPVGQLRFKKARAAKWVKGTQNATAFLPVCLQGPGLNPGPFDPPAKEGAEDCLGINVYRPAGISYKKKLPVVFWIHGGAFVIGTGEIYDPTVILAQSVKMGTPIVYVSINYRLGPWGFLHHTKLTASADYNAGLTDQTLALQFFHKNAAAFGADPYKVTIWGESAGGFSIEAQTVYAPQGLFRAGITDSGYLIAGLTAPDPANFLFWNTSSTAGCGTNTTATPKQAYDCLVKLDAAKLLDAALVQETTVTPALAGDFLWETPASRIGRGHYNKVPSIIGTNRDEGSIFGGLALNTTQALEGYLVATYGVKIGEKLKNAYLSDPTLKGAPITQIGVDAVTDTIFFSDRRWIAEQWAKNANVWTYFFNQTPPGPLGDAFGAHHAAEIYFFYGGWDRSVGTTSQQAAYAKLSEEMIAYLVSFVTTTDPNNAKHRTYWPKHADSNQNMEFRVNGSKPTADNFRKKETSIIVAAELANEAGQLDKS